MPADGFLVAELSSYQLETIKHFRPIGAIMLNITPDHLARHKTMENYAAAKARIFMNQNLRILLSYMMILLFGL